MRPPTRRELAVALIAVLSCRFVAAQDTPAPTPRPALPQPPSVIAHYAGPGVTAPVLLPPSISISLPRQCIHVDGVVSLSTLIDENGNPRDIQVLHSDDARLSNFAIGLVAQQRFKPGMFNGSPAAVAIGLTAGLHTCSPVPKKKIPQDEIALTLSSHPFLEIVILKQPSVSAEISNPIPATSPSGPVFTDRPDDNISAPTPIFQANPVYSKAARAKKIEGTFLAGATIDANGIPDNVRAVSSLEPSLDHNSLETIKTWRFNPALQNGSRPVPFELTIAVTFWIDEKTFFSFTTIVPKPSSAIVLSAPANSPENISPPLALNADEVQVEYSPYGRLAQISGLCVVAFIVDTGGVPQNVRVVKSLETSMDENVVEAVHKLRFQPAMRDGTTPVTAQVIMPIHFKSRLKVTKRDLFENALTTAILIFFHF